MIVSFLESYKSRAQAPIDGYERGKCTGMNSVGDLHSSKKVQNQVRLTHHHTLLPVVRYSEGQSE